MTALPTRTAVTDPPHNYSGSSTSAQTSRFARAEYVSSDAAHTLPDFPSENHDQRSYIRWRTEIHTEAYRTTREHGVALVFTD